MDTLTKERVLQFIIDNALNGILYKPIDKLKTSLTNLSKGTIESAIIYLIQEGHLYVFRPPKTNIYDGGLNSLPCGARHYNPAENKEDTELTIFEKLGLAHDCVIVSPTAESYLRKNIEERTMKKEQKWEERKWSIIQVGIGALIGVAGTILIQYLSKRIQ